MEHPSQRLLHQEARGQAPGRVGDYAVGRGRDRSVGRAFVDWSTPPCSPSRVDRRAKCKYARRKMMQMLDEHVRDRIEGFQENTTHATTCDRRLPLPKALPSPDHHFALLPLALALAVALALPLPFASAGLSSFRPLMMWSLPSDLLTMSFSISPVEDLDTFCSRGLSLRQRPG